MGNFKKYALVVACLWLVGCGTSAPRKEKIVISSLLNGPEQYEIIKGIDSVFFDCPDAYVPTEIGNMDLDFQSPVAESSSRLMTIEMLSSQSDCVAGLN